MTQKVAQSVSPRTQAMGAAPMGNDEDRMFEDGFSQMAYGVLTSKFPDLISNVVTFKILDTDVEAGAGVGAFVVQHGNDTVYIPVVMADNQLKPLDMFYHKNLNVFLPLSPGWLDEVAQLTLDEMGETVAPPKTLRRDVDIRNLVIPPTTGRYAYAAARAEADPDQDLLQMLRHLQTKTAATSGGVLVDFLRKAPEPVKEAFTNTLRQNEKLAAQVAQLYDFDEVCTAVKTASATDPKGGALHIVTKDSSSGEFKDIFGDRAPDAFQRVLKNGYAYKDGRGASNKAIQIQTRLELHTPSKSGFYRVFTIDGEAKPAFVLHNPRCCQHSPEGPEGRHGKRRGGLSFGQHNGRFVVIMNGGKDVSCDNLVGELLDGGEDAKKSDVFNKLLMGTKGDTPSAGGRGLFVQKTGSGFVGTQPFRIKTVSTDSRGVRRITLDNYAGTVLVTDKNAARVGMHQPKSEPLMYIPADARFVKLDDEYLRGKEALLKTESAVKRWFYDRFEGLGARTLKAKNAGSGQVSLNGKTAQAPLEAMKTAALEYGIDFSAAERLVKEALDGGSYYAATAHVLTGAMHEKVAQTPMLDPSSQQMGDAPPPGGAPMDPAMAGGDPSMQAAPPPQPPSPLDIAMGEAQTQINQQMMDLEQQAMALQGQIQTLQVVGQRAQEIAGGGAPVVGQGAPPMPIGGAPQDPAMAGSGAPMPPQSGVPVDPMAGGMGGAPGGAALGGMTGQEPLQDPAAMPEGMAAMSTESPSATEIQNQINPQFLESAGQLDDAGTFDAAAIASMAQAPSFRDVVTDYIPTLERALDNMGRTLLSMWMQEAELKDQIGEEAYTELEDNLRAVFDGLGDLVLNMNQNATVLSQREQGL